MNAKFYRLASKIVYFISIVMIICVIGTAGALEKGSIGGLQFVLQSLGFLAVGAISYFCGVLFENIAYHKEAVRMNKNKRR